jgi:hypothetical protein
MQLDTAFKSFGKKKMVSFLRGEVTKRISEDMSVSMILYTLDSYGLTALAEERLNSLRKDHPHGQLYLGNNYGIWK